jgi:hypothetical protein
MPEIYANRGQKVSNLATVSKRFFPADHQNGERMVRVIRDDGRGL